MGKALEEVKNESCHTTESFNQPAPNMVWVCDFTYIRAVNRFYYLCAVLDLFAVNFITVFLLTLTVFTILSDLILTITVFLLTKRRRCLCLFDFFAVYFIDIGPIEAFTSSINVINIYV